MKPLIKLMGFMLVILGIATACEKEQLSTSQLTVRMSALAGNSARFDAINLEIKQVQIFHKSGSTEGWINLRTNPGIYDFVRMQQGKIYTVVNRAEVRPGSFTKVKIIPGRNNTVVVNGKSVPLLVESTHMDGIIIEHDVRINANEWIDFRFGFDVAESVVAEPNGTYRLKPITDVVHVIHRPLNQTSKAEPVE